MSKQFEFGGMSGVLDPSIEKEFEMIWETDSETIYTSQTYTHEDDEFSFDYYYAVRVLYLEEFSCEEEHEGKVVVETVLVVNTDDIKGPLLDEMFESSCLDHVDDLSTIDVLSHGGADVPIANETVNEDEVDETVLAAFSSISGVDMMRGFYLDRPWNRIGTTGWDVIFHAIGVKENLFW